MTTSEPIDAATTEVIRKYLISTAKEMERTLIRTAYNAIIYEVKDFGISIYNSEFELLADAPGLTLFLGANDYGIEKGVEQIGEENFEPGDVAMLNYPYWSSRHPQDVCIFAPIFHDGEIVGYPVVRAHWIDLGQKERGYLFDATNVHQEGLLVPGVRIYRGGEPDEELLDLIRFNSRAPTSVMGDLNAQIAAIRTGQQRIQELYDKYGADTIEESVHRVKQHGQTKAADGVADLPNGTWTGVDYLDSDGINDDLVRMEAEVTITDDTFTIDLSGSSDEVDGPFNVPIGLTQSFCKICFKNLTTPHLPSFGGQYDPLEIVAPEGNLFNATYPTSTYAITTSIAAIEVVFKALADEIPDRVPASTGGDIGNFNTYGEDPETGEMFSQAQNEGVGWGATASGDGNNGLMHYSETTVRNSPVEIWETQVPVRIDRYQLRQDSGGAGEYRGGLGIQHDYRFLSDRLEASSFQIKTRTDGWGLQGGGPGAKNALVLFPDLSDEWEDRFEFYVDNDEMYEETDDRKWMGMFKGQVHAGEVISNRTGGGGGFGDPLDRDVDAVRMDVKNGYVSIEAARERYGVVIEDGDVETDATATLREEMRASR